MRILIVEDDTSSRLLLKKILTKERYDVSVAINGKEAWEILQKEKFDAVLTDWMMPEMDGLELITLIRKNIKPAPVVIMITALASKDAFEKALKAGTDDYIAKPITREEVLERLKNSLARSQSELTYNFQVGSKPTQKAPFHSVCIATSTGGPQTLIYLFENFKPTNKAAFFIVLHGPAWMLKSFPEKLRSTTSMKVHLGATGVKIEPGSIYLAPGDKHMAINPENFTIQLLDSPPENFVKPSADPLFRSAAKAFGNKTTAVVLTGMGHDGSIGSGYIKAAGGSVIAQDPATAILPSMPAAVIELKIAKDGTPLAKIPAEIERSIK